MDRESAIHLAATQVQACRRRLLLVPHRPAGERVERPRVVRRPGDEHEAVEHERRRLEAASDASLVDPSRGEPRHIAGVDLGELAVAPAERVAAVHPPRARIGLSLDQRRGEQ